MGRSRRRTGGSPMVSGQPVTRLVHAPASAVWDVLRDGWFYGSWVVGSARIREVDDGWPSEGTRLHHSVGLWPMMLDDHTEVVWSVPEKRLVLSARAWPWGWGEVDLQLENRDGQCVVSMTEDVVCGPGIVVPRPARQVLLRSRNRECLRRLALLAERRRS